MSWWCIVYDEDLRQNQEIHSCGFVYRMRTKTSCHCKIHVYFFHCIFSVLCYFFSTSKKKITFFYKKKKRLNIKRWKIAFSQIGSKANRFVLSICYPFFHILSLCLCYPFPSTHFLRVTYFTAMCHFH